jgi:predicted membrane protein
MFSEFLVYLRLGFEHITDPGGYDHLLFVAALTASDLGRFRRLFWLVTAFTVGHSITLALATLDLVRVDISLVEILIPVTILATSATNAVSWGRGQRVDPAEQTSTDEVIEPETRLRYMLAVGFGLIHGLGFSTFLRAALGWEDNIFVPLLSFNIGLEIGQLAIVAVLSLIAFGLIRGLGLTRRAWVLGVSAITGGMAFVLLIQRILISI